MEPDFDRFSLLLIIASQKRRDNFRHLGHIITRQTVELFQVFAGLGVVHYFGDHHDQQQCNSPLLANLEVPEGSYSPHFQRIRHLDHLRGLDQVYFPRSEFTLGVYFYSHWNDQGPPESVTSLGHFEWSVQDDLVAKIDIEQVPFFNAPIYTENKQQIGKIDEIFGNIRDYYVSIKLLENLNYYLLPGSIEKPRRPPVPISSFNKPQEEEPDIVQQCLDKTSEKLPKPVFNNRRSEAKTSLSRNQVPRTAAGSSELPSCSFVSVPQNSESNVTQSTAPKQLFSGLVFFNTRA
ncbi:Similar to CG4038: Probable H/ACA ribonucleoprotein complex subunit 1 (Drosophila melanogaster) [Cotesia congregata]|uniref:H/ACA ribonucleoprotein complex subunit n=1 Tax=Cotesia congregata TaxID=51543 RepID=A0A8J2HAR8_COTCN|nr:Similar to CG4038: Probable H/ACA ribonucleoprotein complex subunit 1 (Drosophila melanogaster) [Cotesia congregata]